MGQGGAHLIEAGTELSLNENFRPRRPNSITPAAL